MNKKISNNPLLQDYDRIPFHLIESKHVVPAVKEILRQAERDINELIMTDQKPTFQNTLGLLDDILESVKARVAPVTHLMSVAETRELREAFNEILPYITQFWSNITLNQLLWERLVDFSKTIEAGRLRGIKKRHLSNTLDEFKRSGADLLQQEKDNLATIRLEISQLEQKFSENILDATDMYSLLVTDRSRLEGLPNESLSLARQKAEEAGEKGWLLTLDYPSFEPVMKYVRDRDLRRELYVAYVTRCRTGEFSNVPIITDLLNLRSRLANILGYEDFADYILGDRMAKTGKVAFDFIDGLTQETEPYWERDIAQLKEHALGMGLVDLQPWDLDFVKENLKSTLFGIDDEVTRPYFPIRRVVEGLFQLVEEVFEIVVTEKVIEEIWHPEVRFYEIFSKDGNRKLGCFYTDWHPREGKRQGAWMNDLKTGGPSGDGFEPHSGIIAGNLTPAKGKTPALLTHREVQTVFHEFGHLLHHLTSSVPIAPMAGINVAWDFVEVPSQLMENWTWEDEVLPLISGHFETGKPMPVKTSLRLREGRQFMGGLNQMRQLALGCLDLRLHRDDPAKVSSDPLKYIEKILLPFSIGSEFSELHSATIFSHIFAGGYASGYYSYLWSEVLEADVFSKFREEGIMNPTVGRAYMESILTQGDSDEPEILFKEFMGRDVDRNAFLNRNLGSLES
tara:strand:- start:2346 stop:4388 length:2043 start_codon:yes stop_codon:yes gene_type:complete